MVERVGSSPPGRRLLDLFQQFFTSVFMLDQVYFSDIAILCNRPIIVINKILSVLMSLYFP